MSPSPRSVGTLREGPLHAALKDHLARGGGQQEVPVDGYVVDVVQGETLIEVQTGSFAPMADKLAHLLPHHRVRLVHPIPETVWIVRVDDAGVQRSRRRSPRRGVAADVFAALVSVPHLIRHPHLTLEIWLTHEDHIRQIDARRRRRGARAHARFLVDPGRAVVVRSPADLLDVVPAPNPFTTAELAVALGRPRRLAQQAAYCLERCGATTRVGKRGNAIVYAHAVEDVSPLEWST